VDNYAAGRRVTILARVATVPSGSDGGDSTRAQSR
jgi:hypothetical protein